MWGKNEGACVPRWRGETRRGRLRAEGRRLLSGNRGRPPKDAAMIETTRHYKLNRAPRYYRPRASACRRAPPAEWTSRSVGRRVPQRSSKCAIALWEARAQAERPPLWGSDDVSAMRNYRYRHRDSPYVAKRSGERTSRAGRPWAVGGELPGARWRGRPVCAMRSAVQGAAAAQTRACRFFSSTSTLGCGAQGTGGAERRTDQFSVRLF